MEIQLRLDESGRTTYDPNLFSSSLSSDGPPPQPLKFSSRTVSTSLATDDDDEASNFLDDLLFDCEIADCGVLPRTFWVPFGAEPRCSLERLALGIFHRHVPPSHVFDHSCSGAEWWVQIRPSPPGTGRYSMLSEKDGDDDPPPQGVCFHWDKDEELRLLLNKSSNGASFPYVHPHLSTVTYLTSVGAPTVVVEGCGNVPGTDGTPETPVRRTLIVWPRAGKHLTFDGRELHAAPRELIDEDDDDDDAEAIAKDDDPKRARRRRRVTFLVNVWLNHRPFGVNPFPATMVDKLSDGTKGRGVERVENAFATGSEEKKDDKVTVRVSGDGAATKGPRTTILTWPLGGGDSDGSIRMRLPLEEIRAERKTGGNVSVVWDEDDGVVVVTTEKEKNKDKTTVTTNAGGDTMATRPETMNEKEKDRDVATENAAPKSDYDDGTNSDKRDNDSCSNNDRKGKHPRVCL